MARVGIVHHDLMQRGGSEAVAVNVVESVREDHDVTLITKRPPEIDEINSFFGVDLTGVRVRLPGTLSRSLAGLSTAADQVSGIQFGMLEEAALLRFARSIEDEFDAMISTHDECCFDGPSIQYLHYPRKGLMSARARAEVPDPASGSERASIARAVYDEVCLRVSRFDREAFDPDAILTNSEWTADLIRTLYRTAPEVVHPPVDARGFTDVPWSDREEGFLCVGRLSPDKNVLRNIEIVDRVRRRGHDVHLHVVGPAVGRRYHRRVRREAEARSYVRLEGALPRDRLVELIARHRYALHGKQREHFGMVVAEYLVGGALPFVPDGGGQCEIVGNRDELVYASADEAVEKIDRVLSTPALRDRLRREFDDPESRFGRERFRRDVRETVDGVVP